MITDSEPVMSGELRLFTLYEDFDAGFRAKRFADLIDMRVGDQRKIARAMWRMGSAKPIGRIHQMMARDAAESDILLVASSAVDQTQHTVIRWLYSLLGWRSNLMLPGLIIGLLGGEDRPAHASDWLVSQLRAFATRNHLEFTWCSRSESITDGPWIEQVLEKIFASRNTGVRNEILPACTAT